MEQGKIFISSSIDNGKNILNDNMRDVLSFKQNIINGRSAGTISEVVRVIVADYPPGFSSDNCIFLFASFA